MCGKFFIQGKFHKLFTLALYMLQLKLNLVPAYVIKREKIKRILLQLCQQLQFQAHILPLSPKSAETFLIVLCK